jgi:hypothetical protein
MRKPGFALFLFLIWGCASSNSNSASCIDPEAIDPQANCYQVYQPVCGCDGNTYSNDCFARINGVKEWTTGECEK